MQQILTASPMDGGYLYCTPDGKKPNVLLLFYCLLASFCDRAHVARPNYFAYAHLDTLQVTNYHALGPA